MNYVPWDTSALITFFNYVKNVIGMSVNVGIIIMSMIMGVLVVINIVKKFTH